MADVIIFAQPTGYFFRYSFSPHHLNLPHMILLSVGIDPILINIVVLVLAVISTAILLRYIKQPSVVGYIIVGVLLGKHGFGLITDEETVTHIGSLGLLLLMFFIGLELSLPSLLKDWKVTVPATILQVILSVGVMTLIGSYFGWKMPRMILLGFVVTMSSSAVLFKLLKDSGLLTLELGRHVAGILIVQDLIIIPMIIAINLMGGTESHWQDLALIGAGGVVTIVFLAWLLRKKDFKIPFYHMVEDDGELELFGAFLICFGGAFLTAIVGLSSALGAFVAGITVAQAKNTKGFQHHLEPFKVLFLALFFVSIGMQVDLSFMQGHIREIGLMLLLVFVLNNVINTATLRLLKVDWASSIRAGAMLSQIGEFSFVLAAIGFQVGIISDFGYQMTVSVIGLSLLVSLFWVNLVEKIVVNRITG